jgi:hypothetical protein
MDSRETFYLTHPRTPPIHPYPYDFPTSSVRDGPPPSQSQVPSPLPHPKSPIPQLNLSLPILPTTPLNRPRLGSPSQDDGNVVETKPQSEPETRTEGPSRPTMPPRPPNIRVPQREYSRRAVKSDNQVKVPKRKPKTYMKRSRHPSSRRDSLVANVEDWLAGVAAARVGVEGRNGGAPNPNGIPPPRPPATFDSAFSISCASSAPTSASSTCPTCPTCDKRYEEGRSGAEDESDARSLQRRNS